MYWIVFLLGLITSEVFADNIVLLSRACQKRPELEFCKALPIPAPSAPERPETAQVSVVKGNTVKKVDLILPPPVPEAGATTAKPDEGEPVDFEINSSSEHETDRVGSLLSLPKPVGGPVKPSTVQSSKNKTESEQVAVVKTEHGEEHHLPIPPPTTVETTVPPHSKENLETDHHVLVFVSEFCVVNRERFVRRCHGDVDAKEVDFCKGYPSSCTGTSNVIPILTYCQRYFREYPKLCVGDGIHELALQFCFSFEQFCLPELTAAAATTGNKEAPKSNLRRCEDVQADARKVCNPFPNPKDTFNVLRCQQFLTHCKKFVDWL